MAEEECEMCPNCKRDIPVKTYMMHTLHCARNVVLCKLCDEPVPKSCMAEHDEEFHTDVSCEMCNQPVPKGDVKDHKEKHCPERQVICKFCHLDQAFKTIEEHEEYCGSRTEKCDQCGDFVKLRDWEKHEQMTLYHELAKRPSTEVFGYDPLDSDPAWKRRQQLTSSKSFSASTPITQPFTAATTYKYNDPPTVPQPSSLTRTHSVDYTSAPTLPMDRAAVPAWQAKLVDDSKPAWQRKFAGDIIPDQNTLEPLAMKYQGSALPMLRKRNDPNSITSRILAGQSIDAPKGDLKTVVDAEMEEEFDYPRPEPTRKSSKMGAVSSAPSLSSFQSPFASSPYASQNKLAANLASTGLGVASRTTETEELASSSSANQLRNGILGHSNGYSTSHMDDLEEDTMIPCEFCDTPISILKLIKHQAECTRNMDSLYFNAHVPIRAESPKVWPSIVNQALYDKKAEDSESSPPPTEPIHASFSIATPPREPSPPSLINFDNDEPPPPPLPPKLKTKKQSVPPTGIVTPFGAIPVEADSSDSYVPTPFGATPVSLLDSEVDFAPVATKPKKSHPKSSQSAPSIVGKYLGPQKNPITPRQPFGHSDFSDTAPSSRPNQVAINGARPKRERSSSRRRGERLNPHQNLAVSPVSEGSLVEVGDRPRVDQLATTSVPHNGARRKVKYQAPQPPKVNSQPSLVPRGARPVSRPDPKPKNQENDLQQRDKLREMLAGLRKDPFDEDLEANDGSFFPCEFCGDPYPVEFIMRHQLSCDLNPRPVTSGEGFDYSRIADRVQKNLELSKMPSSHA